MATAVQPNGNGTETYPYQIADLDNLQWLSETTGSWQSYFIQTADIDATGTQNWNGGAGFTRIGNGNDPFTGSYDGQGHTISNLYISVSYGDLGLFGSTNSATLSNIVLTDCDITGNDGTGALIGDSDLDIITNCGVTGVVNGDFATGGLVGRSAGSTFSSCFSKTAVNSNGGERVGGLVGYALGSTTISNCYVRGIVDGVDKVGGMVGHLNNSSLINCYSAAIVPSVGTDINGLVGLASNTCSATKSYWDMSGSGHIVDPLGTGLNTGDMTYFYGIYYTTGWDFVAESRNGSDNFWDLDMNGSINDGYPYLNWEDGSSNSLQRPSGNGSSGSPYLIDCLLDLFWISVNQWTWDNHHLQTSDIDATDTRNWNNGAGFDPIGYDGYNYFNGCYDGGEHVIDGLYIHPNHIYVGLFGRVASAEISNLNLTNADVDVNVSAYGGALIGYSFNSLIENCHSSGTIRAREAGGMIGYASMSTITRCSSSADVNSSNFGGGLIGYTSSSATVSHSYATGSVYASYRSGGLIGKLKGSASYCYSTGSVSGSGSGGFTGSCEGSINGCFWDTETSGQSTSADSATGLTTYQMQSLPTYLNVGWDFAGETVNGTDDIWILLSNEYPTFANCYTEPLITAVDDIPNDQGHQVLVVWDKSSLDTYAISSRYYSVWMQIEYGRSIDPQAVLIDDLTDFSVSEDNSFSNYVLLDRNTYWTCLSTVPGMGDSTYLYLASTQIDSSSALLPQEYTSTFKVCYHFESGCFSSSSADGYSVDNIAPNHTENIQMVMDRNSRNSGITLSWDEVSEGTYLGNSYPEMNGVWYKIYFSDTPDFDCNSSTYVGVTQDTHYYVDVTNNDIGFFKIVVSDQQPEVIVRNTISVPQQGFGRELKSRNQKRSEKLMQWKN